MKKGGFILLSIAVYSDNQEEILNLKSSIQDFLIEYKLMAKVSTFNNPDDITLIPNRYDIYIFDMDSTVDTICLGKQLMEIDEGSHFIYISSDSSNAYRSSKILADYFLVKPLDKEEFFEVMKDVKREIKEDSVIIKVPDGERRIRVNNLNYINIVKRCLCYHLKDGTMFDGQTLRTSFEKAITPLQENKTFLFLAPSLLINLGEIKIVNKDNIVFENDDVLFFPAKQYEVVRGRWIGYNRMIE